MAILTARQHEKLIDRIATLSELELDQLLKDIGQLLRKNKQEHLIDDAFDMDDWRERVSDLEYEVEKMENEQSDFDSLIQRVNELCDEADDIEDFEEDSIEQLRVIIKKIKNEL